MGSKSSICEKLCAIFPKANNFYDLFGGGFSVTHAMMMLRKNDYKTFHFNEIRSGVVPLIKDAIAGKYNYDVFKPKWISREEFQEKKETDAYIKLCWSFGNNGRCYLFGKSIEQQKKSLHQAVVFNEFDSFAESFLGIKHFNEAYSILQRRLFLKNVAENKKQRTIGCQLQQLEQLQRLQRLQQLEQLQQLQQLERLQQLQRLEQLERLSFTTGSYEKVKILPNSIIYCDIPYGGTAEYDSNTGFNRKDFFNWADDIQMPVYISEYNIEDKRFRVIANFTKRSMINKNRTNTVIKTEKVYANRYAFENQIQTQ